MRVTLFTLYLYMHIYIHVWQKLEQNWNIYEEDIIYYFLCFLIKSHEVRKIQQ